MASCARARSASRRCSGSEGYGGALRPDSAMANAIVTHAKSIRILQAVYSPEVTVSWRGTTDRGLSYGFTAALNGTAGPKLIDA